MSEHHETDNTSPQAPAPEPNGAAVRASFLGFVAHEMRNPLSTALWSAELLARLSPQERGGARGEKLAGMCLRSLQRLRVLVEDHFLAERLDVAGIPVRPETVSLREIVQTAAQRVGVADIDIDIDDDLAVQADRALLERALEGLVAVAARGSVPVRTSAAQAHDSVVLHVRGAAPGPDALQPPQKGTASDPSGRALAVYTALHVARALGGSLSAAGEDFVLSLPFAPAGAAADAT